MNFLRRNFRELLLLAVLFASFLIVNPLIQELSPGSGALDWSFLTLLVAGAFKAVFICVGVWVLLSIFFPTAGKFLDSKGFSFAFQRLNPEWQVLTTGLTICMLTALLTLCVLFG